MNRLLFCSDSGPCNLCCDRETSGGERRFILARLRSRFASCPRQECSARYKGTCMLKYEPNCATFKLDMNA